jgi:hypothetical protein
MLVREGNMLAHTDVHGLDTGLVSIGRIKRLLPAALIVALAAFYVLVLILASQA